MIQLKRPHFQLLLCSLCNLLAHWLTTPLLLALNERLRNKQHLTFAVEAISDQLDTK